MNAVEIKDVFGVSDIDSIHKVVKNEQASCESRKRNGKDFTKSEVVNGKTFKVVYDKEGKLVVPQQSTTKILKLVHVHEPFKLAYRRLNALNLAWRGLYKDLESFHQSCVQCASINPKQSSKDSSTYEYADDFGHLANADVVHINKELFLAMRDFFSGFLSIVKIKDLKMETVKDALLKLFTQLYVPQILVLDNASYFQSSAVNDLAKLLNINLRFITARNSRGNSNIERSFRTLQNLLKTLTATEESLETCVAIAAFIMNNRKQKDTNLTPYEIVTFRHSTFPVNIPFFSKAQVDKLPQLAKKYYETAHDLINDLQNNLRNNKNKNVKNEKLYKKNDVVLLKNYNKRGTKKSFLPAYSTDKFRIKTVNL